MPPVSAIEHRKKPPEEQSGGFLLSLRSGFTSGAACAGAGFSVFGPGRPEPVSPLDLGRRKAHLADSKRPGRTHVRLLFSSVP